MLEDSHADYPTSGLGDDDRRGRDIEQVAQEVGVRRSGIPIGAIMSHKADGGVEIGRSGAADVNLHEGPQRGNGRATRSGRCWTTRPEDTTNRALNPQERIGSIGSHAALLRRVTGRRYDAAHLTRRVRACAVPRATHWRK